MAIKRSGKKRARASSSNGSKVFVNDEAQEKHISEMANGKVVLGKVCNFAFFISQKFRLGEWLHEQSLMDFAEINCCAYTKLVRFFFTNLQVHDNGLRFSTLVNGTKMNIDAELISKIFNIPNDGLKLYKSHSRTMIEGFDYDEEMMKYTGLDVIPKNFKPDATEFLLEYRLLHHVVTYVLFPRSGGKGNVSYFDAYIMWALVNLEKLNFPHLMMHHMIDVWKKKRTSLPYGMALTMIFKHFNLKFENEEYLEPSSTDFYNEGTLKRFGYRKVNDTWVLKKNRGKTNEENVDEDLLSSPQSTQHTPTPPYADFASSSELLQTLKTIVDGNSKIMGEMMMMKHNQEIMMNDIDDIRRNSYMQKDFSMKNEESVKEIRHNVNKLILDSKKQGGQIEKLTDNYDLRREGDSKDGAVIID